jgi:hypothetical protein
VSATSAVANGGAVSIFVSLVAQGGTAKQARRQARGATTMDMSKYASRKFIKPEDLASGPQRKTIDTIEEGNYDKPNVTFHDGSKLSLNGTNVSTLIAAFGSTEHSDWIGEEVELYAGTLKYNGADNPAVLVWALNSSPAAVKAKPKPQPPFDDEVPY